MNPIRLTYVVTTKNKLPYLKNRLGRLFSARKDDEEIIVADAGSTDGTREYLEEMKRVGKLQYVVSEPDFGESHALNKLFLKAKGELVTIITDDDAFHYPAIAACRKFLLENPEVDLVSTEGGSFNRTSASLEEEPIHLVRALDYRDRYVEWQKSHTPFSFCGLGIMFRRTSLTLLGLWDLSFKAADAEYSFRVTAGKANIAWYSGYSFVNISNPQSTTLVFQDKIKNEISRLNKFYLSRGFGFYLSEKWNSVYAKIKSVFVKKIVRNKQESETRFPALADVAEKWLEIKNKERVPEFLWNKK